MVSYREVEQRNIERKPVREVVSPNHIHTILVQREQTTYKETTELPTTMQLAYPANTTHDNINPIQARQEVMYQNGRTKKSKVARETTLLDPSALLTRCRYEPTGSNPFAPINGNDLIDRNNKSNRIDSSDKAKNQESREPICWTARG